MMNRRTALAAAVGGVVVPHLTLAAPSTQPLAAVGKPAPSFDVIDTQKQKRTLVEFKGRPVVLEWSSSSCPFAKAQYDSGRMLG